MRQLPSAGFGVLVLTSLILMTGLCVGQFGGYVDSMYNGSQTGDIYVNTPSQILPSSYLRIYLNSTCFPMASTDNPVIISIMLPPGAYLSQTLATGNQNTASPLPTAGEIVIPLALQEYAMEKKPAGTPLYPAAIPGPNAVQLFRYVAGESEIWIRLNESPALWTYTHAGYAWGFTIGLGGGVWPDVSNSNWGSSGRYQQQATLFIADVRQYDWIENSYRFIVQMNAYDQHTHTAIFTIFQPFSPRLFTASGLIDYELPVMSAVGTEITDFVTGDLNRDGYDDICSIDGPRGRLYWAWGMPGGVFGGLDWIETTGFTPATLDMSDVTGDGFLDCLVSDDTGLLHIYRHEDLFGPQAKESRTAFPVFSLALAGYPSTPRSTT